MIRIDEELDPEEGLISVAPHLVKNGADLFRTLRDSGAFWDLRQMFVRFLRDARPILLASRQSPYLLVTRPNRRECHDTDGNLMAAGTSVARIVRAVSRTRMVKGLLPPGVIELTPHCFRDLFVNFASLANAGPEVLGAALGDTATTAERRYQGHRVRKDQVVIDFIDSAVEARATDEERRRLAEEVLGVPLPLQTWLRIKDITADAPAPVTTPMTAQVALTGPELGETA